MEGSFQSSTWFVTGATGLVGSTIIETLTKSDISIMALVRPDSPEYMQSWLMERDVKIITGDLTDPESYASYLPTVDVVCHAAAVVEESDPETNWLVNHECTRKLLEKMEGCGVKRFIFISTAGVYDRGYGKKYNEDSPIKPISPYTKSKYAAEKEISMRSEIIKSTIIRPPLIIGDIERDRHTIPDFMTKTPNKFIPLVWRHKSPIGFVHAEDLARLVLLAGSRDKTPSLVYNVQSFELDYETIIEYIEDARNQQVTKIHIPYSIMKMMAIVLDFTRKLMKRDPIFRRRLKFLKNGWVFSKERAVNHLGWEAYHQDGSELLRLMSEFAGRYQKSEDIRDLITEDIQQDAFGS